MSLSFLILGTVTLAAAVGAFIARRLVHCALLLIFAFGGLGGLYLGLGAQFVGLVQILIYVGAVSILVIFTILLTRGDGVEKGPLLGLSQAAGILTGLFVAGVLCWAVTHSRWLPSQPGAAADPSTREIGERLMTTHVAPLEVMGVLLTAALIGAVILAVPEGGRK